MMLLIYLILYKRFLKIMNKRFIILLIVLIVSCDEEPTPDSCQDGVYDCEGVCNGNAIEDCFGECGGDAIEDCIGECGGNVGVFLSEEVDEVLPIGNFFINELENNELELWYHTGNPIYGFQFDVYGDDITITNITSEYLETLGFTITYNKFPEEGFTRVLAYYDYGSGDVLICDEGAENGCMRSGCGVLLSFSYTGNIDRIRNIVFGGSKGQLIPMSYY